MTDYYDVELKKHRHQILSKSKKFIKYEFCLEDFNKLVQVVKKYKPLIVIHLAAQNWGEVFIGKPKRISKL